MKSAHKLAAALAVLVGLLAAAYFILAALRAPAAGPNIGVGSGMEAAVPSTITKVGPLQEATTTSTTAAAETSASTSGQQSSESTGAVEPASVRASSAPTPTDQSVVNTLEVRKATSALVNELGQAVAGFPSELQPPGERPGEQPANQSPAPASTTESSSPSTTTAITTTTTTTSESATSEEPSPGPPPEAGPRGLGSLDPSAKNNEPIGETAAPAPPAEQRGFQLTAEELSQWQEFMRKFGKVYTSAGEEQYRAEIFAGNLRFINNHNTYSRASYRLAVNKFADMRRDEINDYFIGPNVNWGSPLSSNMLTTPMKILHEPEPQADEGATQDWRNLTTGDPVDQGTCMDSAIFALTASLEATLNAQNAQSEKIKLSERQIIDCLATSPDQRPPTWPPICSGNLAMDRLLSFLQRQAVRLLSQRDYETYRASLKADEPPSCQQATEFAKKFAPAEPRPKVGSYGQVHRDNLDEALINRGPLVVPIDGSQSTFHFYSSGLYHELQCSTDTYNFHGLLVGLASHLQEGEVEQGAYYTMRASLGPHWGERGHIRLLKDPRRNKCLPQQLGTYPNIAYE